jgi:hypothetical protein
MNIIENGIHLEPLSIQFENKEIAGSQIIQVKVHSHSSRE